MDIYGITVPVYVKYLKGIERWIDKAVMHAESRKFDPSVYLETRLAPDQFNFLRQVTVACDTAKWAAAKLAGKEAPVHPDTETTLPELRARLKTVIAYLETFEPKDFEGAEDRPCHHAWMGERRMRGVDYVHEYALPNFFFHVTSAYQILRHGGVELGKRDFLGRLTFA